MHVFRRAAVAALWACIDSASAQPARPPALVVLGDSLSDVGNAAAVADYLIGEPFHPEHGLGLCNPADRFLFDRGCEDILFRQSRVSDGPVAVEHLARHLGDDALVASFHTVPERPVAGTDYAVAGGKARASGPEDLAHQLQMLLLEHGPLLPPETTYVVMIGGNDAIDALQATVLPALEEGAIDDPRGDGQTGVDGTVGASADAAGAGGPISGPAAQIVADAVAAIGEAVELLAAAGAECVIVANVPNLAALPAVRDSARASGAEAASAIAEDVSRLFNTALGERLDQARASRPDAALVSFDLFAAFETQRAAAAQAGLNTTDACFDSETYRSSLSAKRRFHPDCAPNTPDASPRFDEFFFWDGLHPTGAAHALIGERLIEAQQTACASQPMSAATRRP